MNRLKELRVSHNLTQSQIAKYLNVDQSLVARFENGTRELSVTHIEKICNLFDCSEEHLFGKCNEHIPLNFAFKARVMETEDLESIAEFNKIARNIKEMNRIMREPTVTERQSVNKYVQSISSDTGVNFYDVLESEE